jgi:penicillin-binding protein 2
MSFGFGRKFGIDIPGELNGNIPSANYYDKYHGINRWHTLTIISLAIGQGEIGITPLQLANLAALIANRGYYFIPHIIKATSIKDNLIQDFLQKKTTDIDPKYFNIVVEAMHGVVEAGTARNAKMDSIAICGKTGTAQNPHGKNHSIFIAFAPMDNPKIAISVIVENAGFGATWAAPIASLMIEKYLTREVKRKEVEQAMINANLIPSR